MKPITYGERAGLCTNSAAKALLQIMESKKTNLAVAADVVKRAELIDLIHQVGPEICVLKTHIDILDDFDASLPAEITKLAKKYQFMVFEDRKFTDIGNTVLQQYEGGVYKIKDWAHIVNANALPGPGIVQGLQKAGLPKGNGMLLIAEMSSKGNLLTEEYAQASIAMAKTYPEFVIGFVSQRRLTENPAHLYFTPGVSLETSNDTLGQQYRTPRQVIHEDKCDIIIVGRSILKAKDPAEEARRYRREGWTAYEYLP